MLTVSTSFQSLCYATLTKSWIYLCTDMKLIQSRGFLTLKDSSFNRDLCKLQPLLLTDNDHVCSPWRPPTQKEQRKKASYTFDCSYNTHILHEPKRPILSD